MSAATNTNRLKRKMQSLLWQAMHAAHRLQEAVTVRGSDEELEALLQIAPTGSGADPSGIAFPGNHFSPLESAIWLALADGPLAGNAIAARLGQPYDTTCKIILRNLKDRGVLIHGEDGYARATPDADEG